jgi:hypothetical protein
VSGEADLRLSTRVNLEVRAAECAVGTFITRRR